MAYRYPDVQIPRRTGKYGPDPLLLYYVTDEELSAIKAVIPWLSVAAAAALTTAAHEPLLTERRA